jgi:hypothetical protein
MNRDLSNIRIDKKGKGMEYKPPGTFRNTKGKYPIREDKKKHGNYIERQFIDAWNNGEKIQDDKLAISAITRKGIYLEIRGKAGYELITKSLEDTRQGVRLLNVQEKGKGEDREEIAIVFVPKAKQNFFLNKIQQYVRKDIKGTNVVATIEHIENAFVESLWTGDKSRIPGEKITMWCEAWLRYETKENPDIVVEEFYKVCDSCNVLYKKEKIIFPERIIVGISVTFQDLKKILFSSDRLAEIREMHTPNDFFTHELNGLEKKEWIKDLLDRTEYDDKTDVTICLLDSGVNNGHPLLERILLDADKHSVDPAGGVNDKKRHGTRMAGIAEYFDLGKSLEEGDVIKVLHRLESVKIIDSDKDNTEELYGDITSQAINLAEIERPQAQRIVCMAVTTDMVENGHPSSWSGAIDEIVAGTYNGENRKPRLMFISAGNTAVEEIRNNRNYLNAIVSHPIEDPGQAWNAVTVGAYTEKISIDDEKYQEYQVVADNGDISPFTSTSMLWDKKWPIKPEIVLEGGNLACNIENNDYTELPNLQLLTTNADFSLGDKFDTISMTSSATAQAAWIAANIQKKYPELRPETIRALMVHSAEWTENMKKNILKTRRPIKKDYRKLLRICGYGVPSLELANWSAKNSVNLIIEDELQPYIKKPEQANIALNEMHMHELPWPSDMLLELDNALTRMKVTLSYYIEPGPGEIGWKDKYRYPSCGLVFDVNTPNEDEKDFTKRISEAMRDEDDQSQKFNADSSRWILGSHNRDVGSIHSDIWVGTASDLSQSNLLMVYPVTGWWKVRTNQKKYNSKVNYSLIITIETPENEVELYTEIKNKIVTKTEITAL